jgi:hypothetical protein
VHLQGRQQVLNKRLQDSSVGIATSYKLHDRGVRVQFLVKSNVVGLDDVEKRKFLTLPRLKVRPLGRPARSQSLYRLSYPGSFQFLVGARHLSLLHSVHTGSGALPGSYTRSTGGKAAEA